MNSGKICTVIPSRLGSNRIKLKGMRLLNGKTLIEHTVDAAKESRFLSESIYLNSDSEIWGSLAKHCDINFYQRSPNLATSSSPIDEYLYDFLSKIACDYLAVLTPTAPFITGNILDEAWNYLASNTFDSIISAERIQTHCVYLNEPLNYSKTGKLPRTQDLEPIMALNFSIAIYNSKTFIKNFQKLGYAVLAGKIGYFEVSGISKIDIDYEEDFQFANYVANFIKDKQESAPLYSPLVKDLILSDSIST